MGADTSIEWTHPPGYRGATWNPVNGCEKVSPGCKHCYAASMARRIVAMGGKASERYKLVVIHRGADGKRVDCDAPGAIPTDEWNGTYIEVPELLDLPLRTRTPTCWFVNSMSDLFGEGVSDEYIAAVFGVMAACPQHRFQVLTKRAERMARWFEWVARQAEGPFTYCFRQACFAIPRASMPGPPPSWPLPWAWIGVSVEDQQRADERIPHLLRVPAAVRFLSVEPLLSAVNLTRWLPRECTDECVDQKRDTWNCICGAEEERQRFHWVIVGGESGPGARPMDLAWARSIVAQCKAAGVACFVKQLGARPTPCAAEMPFFGARYNDGVCIDGMMWDLDSCDVPGGLLYSGGDQECPECKGTNALKLRDKKGGDPAEWPADLRVRLFPGREYS